MLVKIAYWMYHDGHAVAVQTHWVEADDLTHILSIGLERGALTDSNARFKEIVKDLQK